MLGTPNFLTVNYKKASTIRVKAQLPLRTNLSQGYFYAIFCG